MSQNLTISSLSFIHCGQFVPPRVYTKNFREVKASLAFDTIGDLALISLGVYNSTGYGILVHITYGNSIVRNCELLYNRGSENYRGGNLLLSYTDCHKDTWKGAEVKILDSVFSFGGYSTTFNIHKTGVFATGITVTLSCTEVNITMDNVTAEGNQNDLGLVHRGYGGNVYIHIISIHNLISNRVLINNSRFIGGSSWLGGGIGISLYIGAYYHNATYTPSLCESTMSIENSIIDGNRGIAGSGLYINYVQDLLQNNCTANLVLINCTLRNNHLCIKENGTVVNQRATGVVAILDDRLSGVTVTNVKSFFILFDDVTIEYSTMETPLWGFAALHAKNFLETFKVHNCRLQHNSISAISLMHSHLTFSGSNVIKNNSGVVGGGMVLCESSNVVLKPNTSISLIQNQAMYTGGGIFADDSCPATIPLCFYQVDNRGSEGSTAELGRKCNITVIMTNNTAGFAGSQIYGGSVGECYIFRLTYHEVGYYDTFKSIFYLEAPSTDQSTITSSPKEICFCSNSSTIDCSEFTKHYEGAVYPGENISLFIVIVGQLNGTVPGTLKVNNSVDRYSYHNTGTSCTQINFTALTMDKLSASYEFALTSQLSTNTSYHISLPKHLTVIFRNCPKGFKLTNGTCGCDSDWEKISCDFTKLTLTRTSPAWLGFTEDKEMVYQNVCPYDYCQDGLPVDLKIVNDTFDPDEQCSPNRTGLLCGACKEKFSSSASSSKCISCTDHPTSYLVNFIAGQIISGIVLIALLFLANWTITGGTFSGLLFYANIFKLYMFFFLPHRFNAVTVILSMINLDFHVTNCIYNGLDSYAKAWLSFVFPVYVWILIAVIIYLSKRFKHIARLFGGNGVKILATLIELSYTGLTQAVVIAVSPIRVTVFRENTSQISTLYRWIYDPNVPYLEGKHIPLFLTGILFGVLILAHTLVLLFVQPLQSCSHLPCFSWVAKLKPLIDAYTSPHLIKAKCRFWPGLLLTVRLVLVITLALNDEVEDFINITAITSSCFFLAIVAWSVGGIYRKIYLNVLNSFFVLNLFVLIVGQSIKPSVTISYISSSLTIAVMLFVILSHVAMRLRKCLSRNRRYVIFLRNPLQDRSNDHHEESDLLQHTRD